MDSSIHSMPVNLLLEGCACLVVGAGRVALRKVGALLESGALVTLVSPECDPELAALVERAGIDWRRRVFASGDVEGMTLVFAATNDRAVNQTVLEACRARGILCCCVDGNWRAGDFTTPAVTRHGDISVAISTGGKSCRRAKLVKNALARHIDSIDSAELIVVGTDHHHLPLERREAFHIDAESAERIGFMLMQVWGVHEFMLLDTCNRVEIAAVVSREAATNGVLRHVLGFDRLAPGDYYLKRGEQAWEHMALVCAGMGSQTPGEKHIAAQIKSALATALEQGWAGAMMQDWISAALHASKHIKNEVVPAMPVREIEDLALEYLQEFRPDLSSATVMLIGGGEIGRALERLLRGHVGRLIWCYHSRRPDVPADTAIEICRMDELECRLSEADAVLSAVDCEGYALDIPAAERIDPARGVCVIDLGVPRNSDPAIRSHPNLKCLVDMDDLKRWNQSRHAEFDGYIAECRRIIRDHRDQYLRLVNSFQGANASGE